MSVSTDWIYMVEWTARYLGDMRTFRYATRSFRFGPTVDAAWGTPRYESITGATTYEHMYVPGRVNSITIESNMHAPGCTRGELSIDTCTIVLDNEGGGLDKLRAARCAGRIVRIFRINPGDLADFACIWHGTAAGYLPPGDESITLRGRGFQYLLDRPLLVNRFAGTNAGGNGLEGEAEDLKGKTKPMFMGKRFNFEPPEVNTAKKIFQIDGQIGELQPGATFDVMDAGWPFMPGADYASLADLEATPPATGEWRLFRGPGGVYFRIGTTPTGAVTVNGENPMSAYVAGSVVAPIAGYVTGCEAQILMVALLRWLQVNELNAAGEVMSIQGLHSLCSMTSAPASQEAGLWLTEDVTYRQVLQLLGTSIGGALTFNAYQAADSYLRVGFAQLVAWSGETLTIEEHEVLRFEPGTVGDGDEGLPAKAIVVNYKRNDRVMTRAEVAGSVAASTAAALGEEWRAYTKPGMMGLTTQHPAATELVVDTALADEASAVDLADDVLSPLHSSLNVHVLATVEIAASTFDDFILSSGRGEPGAVFGKHTKVVVNYPRHGATNLECWLIGYKRTHAKTRNTVELTLYTQEFYGSLDPEQ